MELVNLKDYLEIKTQEARRRKEKSRFKFATSDADGRLMFYVKSKYRSNLRKKNYTQESAVFVYDKNGNHIITQDFSGDKVVSFDDIKSDLDNFRILDTLSPSAIVFTDGNLLLTKSIYLAQIGVERPFRKQGIASSLLEDFEKYSQVNEYEKIYGHGYAFDSPLPRKRTDEEERYLRELVHKYGIKKISESNKDLILFYTKKGYSLDRSISNCMDMCEYPFAFSKNVEHDRIISQNEKLYLKESKNKFDNDKIFLA